MDTQVREPSEHPTMPVEVVREFLHDLGGPLVAVQGFLSLIERTPPGPTTTRYMEALRESVENMRLVLERARSDCRKRDGR